MPGKINYIHKNNRTERIYIIKSELNFQVIQETECTFGFHMQTGACVNIVFTVLVYLEVCYFLKCFQWRKKNKATNPTKEK